MIDPLHPDFTRRPGASPLPFCYRAATPRAPAVSIVTPLFNRGPVFLETAATVMGQSLQQFEWLIVNDASDDADTLRILAEMRSRDARIRVLDHERNRGLAAARNTGARHAGSGFILFLDVDDLLEPTAAEKMWWYLLAHPEASFVGCYTVVFGDVEKLGRTGFHWGRRFLERNRATSAAMIRRAAFEAAGGADEDIRQGLEDWDFWLRCAEKGLWGGTVPEYLYWYRGRRGIAERWPTWGVPEKRRAFERRCRRQYADLYAGRFPTAETPPIKPFEPPPVGFPRTNTPWPRTARGSS